MLAAVSLALGGCGTQHATVRSQPTRPTAPSTYMTTVDPKELQNLPNPGTGHGDPRLTAALLTSFQTAHAMSYLGIGAATAPAHKSPPDQPTTAADVRPDGVTPPADAAAPRFPASLEASERASRASQPRRRTKIR